MRTALGAAAALVLASALPALADDMPGMNMDSMPTEPSRARAQIAEANGTVKAVDVAKGTITISHGAVPTLKWPPMTMAFAASQEQLKRVEAGENVTFAFKVKA
ncbi:copper-binding protein [Pseudomonas sp. DY-1]|uniref:copper-binding protein n=1 Tax=Pseudomonas sp. DY-1 TaxID=1755504 RepID=UPI0021149EF0|nr:copper-binding protein [Pseudomonas sp. DY-1]